MGRVGHHLATCAMCAQAAHQTARENALMLSALEPEMSLAVPTEQLRVRITAAIEGPSVPAVSETPARGFARSGVQFLSSLLSLTPQRRAAFASVLTVLILGSIFVVIELRNPRNLIEPPVVETGRGWLPPLPP